MLAQMVRGWNEMSLYRKIRRILSILLIGVGVWALTPYLYNREVNEDFPAPAAQPAPQTDAAQPAAQPATKELIAGAFTNGVPGHSAEGRAVVYGLDGGKRSLRLEDFSVTNGPDLFVVLSPNANPLGDGIGGSYLQVEALKGNKGNQNYDLATNVDLNSFKSIVIWCRSFNVVFGFAPLQGTNAMAPDAAMAQPATTGDAAMAQEATASDAAMMAEATKLPKQDFATGPVALHSGTFIDGPVPGDKALGRATIYQLDTTARTLRLEDFESTNGPDLFVVLSPNANPAQDGIGENYLQLAGLKGNKGNQNYDLASDLDLNTYKSVVIWCRAFNIVFGYATLQPAP